VSKFSLIDLAGSEKITDFDNNRERIQEAKFINKSLSALGNVVAALKSKKSAHPKRTTTPLRHLSERDIFSEEKYIPYRDSKLTHILKDSLGQNSFTTFIVTFSPSSICYTETLSTLAFATNAKAVRQQV
jgi:hypothetical protein